MVFLYGKFGDGFYCFISIVGISTGKLINFLMQNHEGVLPFGNFLQFAMEH
jgi:hypothetical protein